MTGAPRTRLGSHPRLTAAAFAALAACWLAPMSVAWTIAPSLAHSWAVPLLIAFLYWDRWDGRPAASPRCLPRGLAWALGAAALLLQLPLRLLIAPYPLWPTLLAGYTLLGVAVALAAAWQWGGRAAVGWTAGPLVLLLSALPAPAVVEQSLILPLREGMAAFAAEISALAGHPAVAWGTSVQLASAWVGIDDACGGIRSLQACLMLALFFGEWHRFPIARRLGLVAGGALAAAGGNFGRVLFLLLRAGTGGGPAVQTAHDAAGWIAMLLSLLFTGWLACHWAGYRWPARRATPPRPASPAAAGTWLALVALGFVVIDAATRCWYHFGEMSRSAVPRWTVQLPGLLPSFQPSPLTELARDMLHPDFYVAGSWRTAGDLRVSAYYVEWRRGQVARYVPFLHNPTVCLPYAGCELIEEFAPITVRWSGGRIPFRSYKFRRGREDLFVAFTIWDPAKGAPLEPAGDHETWFEALSARWADVQAARENQPAQLLSITLSEHYTTPKAMETLLLQVIN